jgi:hypothetical protein
MIVYLDKFLDKRHLRDIAEDQVLRVFLENSESVWDSTRILVLLSL